ncbi:hypothetical protein ONZ45_g13263 [Pleurotus djamor]|nr:hypothetical protein ONZ45_g13263 [Pleurotus djamor]
MNDHFPITEARLVGLFLECIAYGIFLVTFPLCMHALLWHQGEMRRLKSVNWLMFSAAILLAAFATFDVIITLVWLIKAFVFAASGRAQEVFTDISNWINVTRTVNFLIPILIGDLILIYRGWVVYCYSCRAILFPGFIWICAAAIASYIIHAESHLHVHGLLQVDPLKPFYTSFLVITVAQNVFTTTMIILRIRYVDRLSVYCITGVRRKTKLQRVMRIVIESGLLYTTTAVICLATYLSVSCSYNSVTDAEVPILVIAFNLIIIRAKSQPSENTEYAFTTVRGSTIQVKVQSIQFRSTVRSGMPVLEEVHTEKSDSEVGHAVDEFVSPSSKSGPL